MNSIFPSGPKGLLKISNWISFIKKILAFEYYNSSFSFFFVFFLVSHTLRFFSKNKGNEALCLLVSSWFLLKFQHMWENKPTKSNNWTKEIIILSSHKTNLIRTTKLKSEQPKIKNMKKKNGSRFDPILTACT